MDQFGPPLPASPTAHPWSLSYSEMKGSSRSPESTLTTSTHWSSSLARVAPCLWASPQAFPSTCIRATQMLSCASSAASIMEASPPSRPTGLYWMIDRIGEYNRPLWFPPLHLNRFIFYFLVWLRIKLIFSLFKHLYEHLLYTCGMTC